MENSLNFKRCFFPGPRKKWEVQGKFSNKKYKKYKSPKIKATRKGDKNIYEYDDNGVIRR